MLRISQSKYIDTIVKRLGMKNSKRCLILMIYGISLSRSISPKTPKERVNMDRIPYALAIGSIIYIILYTRSDIAHECHKPILGRSKLGALESNKVYL